MRGPKHYGLTRWEFVIGALSNFLIDHFGLKGLQAAIWLKRRVPSWRKSEREWRGQV